MPPVEDGFAARILQHAADRGEAIAIQCGEDRISWTALARRAAHMAADIADAVPAGARVALIGEASADYLVAFLGVVLAGASAVTLPLMLKADAQRLLLDDSEARLVLASAAMMEAARSITTLPVRALPGDGEGDVPASLSPRDVSPDAEFNIVYSSGTTGTPKGILHSHRTRLALARTLAGLGFDAGGTTLVSTPLYTNMSLPAFLTTLWAGGRTLVMPAFDSRAFLSLAAAERASHFFLVPTQVERILADPLFPETDLSATRLKYVAGSLLRPELKGRLVAEWPGRFVEVYGMTEGAPATVLMGEEQAGRLGTVGRPLGNSEIRIIDDGGRALPQGETGEIVGRSDAMMLGYNNQPALYEQLVWRDADGTVFFRSGDLGWLDDDGFLTICGRKKDMIISGGLNIYPADIEDVLLAHPAVIEAAVIAVPSAAWGESPHALIVSCAGIEADALLAWANERLGKHQRLAGLELRDALPRNALGKVLKAELRAPYWDAGHG